jgi:hypothetical protein
VTYVIDHKIVVKRGSSTRTELTPVIVLMKLDVFLSKVSDQKERRHQNIVALVAKIRRRKAKSRFQPLLSLESHNQLIPIASFCKANSQENILQQ